jgi:type 1 glutamine amidotransferase
MFHSSLRTSCVLLSLFFAVGLADHAFAKNVLILSAMTGPFDPQAHQNQLRSVLQAYGHNVTIGNTYETFAEPPVDGQDVVLLDFDGDMPITGQQALVDFVSNGGGLIANAWTFWKWAAQDNDYFVGRPGLERLGILFPIQRVRIRNQGLVWPWLPDRTAPLTLRQGTPDPVLTSGIPQSFSFLMDDLIYGGDRGSEACLVAQPTATVFYISQGSSCDLEPMTVGLVGWRFGAGHVLQFSTLLEPIELADATYGRLIANAVTWAGNANRGPRVAELRFDVGATEAGQALTATFLGVGLTDSTYFDVRFRVPGSTTNAIASDWQQGTSAQHTIASGTPFGEWTVTGVRSHQKKDDHAGEFDPVSTIFKVTP